jgi:hypothetical protein
MSIHQALQLSYASRQFSSGYFDRDRGSDQILGQHLLPILSREQLALRAEQPTQLTSGLTAHPLPFVLGTVCRQLARLVVAFLG